MVEQHTVGFVMQPLGRHEGRIDRFRLAVEACDQLLTVTLGFLVLHGVPPVSYTHLFVRDAFER